MPPPPPGFVLVPTVRARLWVRAGMEAMAPVLLDAWEGQAAEWLAGGRAPHPVVPLAGGAEAVVRRYLRGGAVRYLSRDRYLAGDRAARELAASEAARAGGVRTPEVIAAGRRGAGVGYRAMIATRRIPDVRDAAAVLAATPEPAPLLEAVGAQLAAMHRAGIGHPDVNLRNVLLDAAGRAWLIDFDRARLYRSPVPAARRVRDLRRFARSARRLGVPLDVAALRRGYGAEWPLGESPRLRG